MCGIFAYKGKKQAAPIILEGLKRLEYRGYDSAGIMTADQNRAHVTRVVGSVSNLEADLQYHTGNAGIGHTRWATHGVVSELNAHPQHDCERQRFVVHNGVIKNHVALREGLEACGHVFLSNTDTEVIAHLLEQYSMAEIGQMLEGDYAFVALTHYGAIVQQSRGIPLHTRIIGDDLYISSDPAAFPPYEDDAKRGYVHHMLAEIHDQRTMPFVGQRLPEISRYVFVGCGSSYHAAMYGAELARQSGIPAEACIASEFNSVVTPDDLVVAITQSGETYDVLQALREAADHGAGTAVITNTPYSTAANLKPYPIMTLMNVGNEVAVGSTKTFTASLAIMQANFGTHQRKTYDIEGIMDAAPIVGDCLLIGKGLSYPIALEGALKLRECAYLSAWGIAAGELKHGSLALITPGYPVVCVGPGLETAKSEIEARGGRIITVNTGDDIQDAITLQCCAYKSAVSLGIDPDRPRNLAKSVTVE